MSCQTFGEAYGEQQYLRGIHSHVDNPGTFSGRPGFDSQVTAVINDNDGNQYKFVHSHSDDLQHGRPLPRVWQDCPRPDALIDHRTGECMDQCRIQQDCALGYTCQKKKGEIGYCVRDTCKTDADCSGDGVTCGQDGLCQPVVCTHQLAQKPNLYTYNDYTKTFVPMGFQPNIDSACIATSHYRLKGRTDTVDITGDHRYAGMY